MKVIIIVFLTLLITGDICAQTFPAAHPESQYLAQQILRWQSSGNSIAHKATTAKERLIARDTYSDDFSFYTDSEKYKYSGINGSEFDFNFMQYSQSTAFENSSPIVNLAINHFPALQPLIRSDTSIELLDSFTTPSSILYNTYNSDSELTSQYYLFSTTYGLYYQFNYNSLNQPVSLYTYEDTIGLIPSDTIFKRLLTYNGSGQLIEDSSFLDNSGVWSFDLGYSYVYDMAGKLTQVKEFASSGPGSLTYYSYALTYNGSGQLTAVVADTGIADVLTSKETFGYTGGINYITSDSTYNWTDSTWTLGSTILKHINVSGVPDTVNTLYYTDSTISYNDISVFYYDSYNNPTREYDSVYYSGSSSVTEYHFYYETYPPTGIANIMQQQEQVTIYPNPVTDNLTIRTNKSEPIRVVMYNTLGRQVMNINPLGITTEHTLSLTNIDPGNYWLCIYNNSGLLHSQTVIKE